MGSDSLKSQDFPHRILITSEHLTGNFWIVRERRNNQENRRQDAWSYLAVIEEPGSDDPGCEFDRVVPRPTFYAVAET